MCWRLTRCALRLLPVFLKTPAVERANVHPLVTQLYFATDEVFEGNPDKNFTKDPLITSRDLVRPVVLDGGPGAAIARVTFELVLEKA